MRLIMFCHINVKIPMIWCIYITFAVTVNRSFNKSPNSTFLYFSFLYIHIYIYLRRVYRKQEKLLSVVVRVGRVGFYNRNFEFWIVFGDDSDWYFWHSECALATDFGVFSCLGRSRNSFFGLKPQKKQKHRNRVGMPVFPGTLFRALGWFWSPRMHSSGVRGSKMTPKSSLRLKKSSMYISKWLLGERTNRKRTFVYKFQEKGSVWKGKNLPKCSTVVAKLSFS